MNVIIGTMRNGTRATLRQPRLFTALASSMMQCSTQTNKPVVAAKMPFRVKVTGGKRYVWCACGHSKKQVQRSTLSTEPVIASKKPFKAELVCGKRHSWCTCGHREKQPFCDGTHKAKAQGLMPQRFVPEKDSKA